MGLFFDLQRQMTARTEPVLAEPERSGIGLVALPAWLCAAILLAMSAALSLTKAGSLSLADPEESRCALIVQEMIQQGDWMVPHLEGQPYYEKPAPYFWLVAASQKLTGSLELGGRLVSALAGMAAVLLAFAWAARLKGNLAGLLAGLMLATSLEFFFLARWYRMDMPFAAFMFAALWWFWRYEPACPATAGADDTKRAGPLRFSAKWLGFYVFCAGATLMKGPLGLCLPGVVVVAYLLMSGRPRRAAEALNVPAIMLYLLLASPWFVATSLSQPGYFHEFFITQHVQRYSGQRFQKLRAGGIAFIPILLAGLMPWTVYLPGTIVRTFPGRWRRRLAEPGLLMLWLAAGLPLLVFLLSSSSMPNYVLPCYPPLAVLAACPLHDWVTKKGPDRLYGAGAVVMRIVTLLTPLAIGGAEWHYGWLDRWIAVPVLIVAICVIASSWALRRGRKAAFLCWIVAAIGAGVLYAELHTGPPAYELRSRRQLGLAIRRQAGPRAVLCRWAGSNYSFPLYYGRGSAGDIDASRPANMAKLANLLRTESEIYCLVPDAIRRNALQTACGCPLTVVASQGSACVITRIGPPIGPLAGG